MILIAGPCVIETYSVLQSTIETILESLKNEDFYFKASCVKDNRTSSKNFYGVGMELGIEMLSRIKSEYKVKTTTDFHNTQDIEKYGKEIDLIQIPAYLAQQTSLIVAAAQTKNKINIKKPQFLGPEEAVNLINKIIELNISLESIIMTDRGTMLGYNQLFIDPRHIPILKKTGAKIITDVTHPNKNYPGDLKENIFSLSSSSIASGSDGLFMEIHPNPGKALCDSSTMLKCLDFSQFIKKMQQIEIISKI